ncbi:phosphate/phosphite/phosphonate ABC transporter substrate-binding protein [Paraburkholderia sp.]|uniref:phosphate/phosphite/phosphonate ABC transporter substrate-binding protein n=1 Tax=Paraburkholderia sp. TaxID=1926495 RepID=UPI003D6DAEF8
MYNASTRTADAWHALFRMLFAELGLRIDIVAHAWPLPLSELWARDNLACGFMCGWPFVNDTSRRVVPLAVPVPEPASYAGLPRYRSEFLVHRSSEARSLSEALSGRIGWMAVDSQSGYQAPRAALGALSNSGEPLFSESKGPLHTPARVLNALNAGEIDLTAVDSFYLDLVRHHAPESIANLRTVGYTSWTPIPLLVASSARPSSEIAAIGEALRALHTMAGYEALMRDVLVRKFIAPDIAAYGTLLELAKTFPSYDTIR